MWAKAALLAMRHWKLIAAVAALACIVWWHFDEVADAREEGALIERAKLERKLQEEIARERQHQREVNDEIDRQHYAREAALRRRVNRLLSQSDGPIRMCEPADQVRAADTASQPHEASADGGSALRAGEDLRPQLVLYGERCEELRRRLIDFQRWAGQSS